MLVPGDIIAAKFLRQLTTISAEDFRTVLREADAAEDSSFDVVARLSEKGLISTSQVRALRRYVAMFEHVRHEAFYLRRLQKVQELPHDQVIALIARIELDAYRRRLGSVLVDAGIISPEQAAEIEEATRRKVFKEDLKVLERYRAEDFAGIGKPMFPGKKIDPKLFRISVLFQPPGTEEEVQREIVKLKLEANIGDLDIRKTGAFEFAPKDHAERSAEEPDEPDVELPAEAMRKVRKAVATARFKSLAKVDSKKDEDPLKERRTIGPYRVVECLGEGGMGAVFLAQDARNLMTAVKVTRQLDGAHDEARRFEREARIMSLLSHRNLPKLLDSGQTSDSLRWMAISLHTGDSLREVLKKRQRLELEEALDIFIEVLEALTVVHSANIVHRDIKPENVFIQPGPRRKVTLIDFGIARFLDDDKAPADRAFRTKEGIVSGSPAYIAPETISSDPIDARTDLYSAGILLFEMLTGILPLRAETPYDYLREHLIGAPLLLRQSYREKSWHDDLERLIARMLAKERQDRPESAQAVLDELRDGLRDTAISTYNGGPPPKSNSGPSIFNSFFNILGRRT